MQSRLVPLLTLLMMLTALLITPGCSREDPTSPPATTPEADLAPGQSSFDPQRGLHLRTNEGDLVRAYVVSANEMVLSISTPSGASYEIHYQPHQVVQRATELGRTDELVLADDHGVSRAWFNGAEFARSDGAAKRPAARQDYERSLIVDNPHAARLLETLNDDENLPEPLRRLIIDEDGYCKDDFVSLMINCVEATCFIPNPVCSACIGAIAACVSIAIYNAFHGGPR